jgi:hypothetical protein
VLSEVLSRAGLSLRSYRPPRLMLFAFALSLMNAGETVHRVKSHVSCGALNVRFTYGVIIAF